ncbi:Hypothetical predicted protein [Mytilus galloprovincialis]|uniref:Uncharacterized protein n=1 Tax=Mytilus galloprovincialis TaxID=29158 RepID=A0A8B6GL68_MYTGA|nr:Hypothetical predicted protein [Mytilus galloprovincialis]
MQLSLKESISAVIDTSETIDFSEFGNSLPLDQALQESLVDYDACFICAYDTSFLALKHGQDLFLFDSHARNEFGLKHSNGKSLLLKLGSLDHLYQYCCNMVSGASQNQWFESYRTEKERIRYRKDEEFKARKTSTLKRKYWENEGTRLKKVKKYEEDQTYRDNLIQAGIKKYREDKDYRDALKESGIQKYQKNDKYREKLKQASVKYKYEEDEQHKKHVKQASVKKYKEDEMHKEHLKQASVQKYKEDEKHKEHVKQASIQKYADDDSHRCKVKQQTETRRENLKEENKQITEVVRKFKDAVQKGPECVCSCCLRLFFEKQVLICKKGSYDNSIYMIHAQQRNINTHVQMTAILIVLLKEHAEQVYGFVILVIVK